MREVFELRPSSAGEGPKRKWDALRVLSSPDALTFQRGSTRPSGLLGESGSGRGGAVADRVGMGDAAPSGMKLSGQAASATG
jgi:hypothetical protein